MRGGRWTCDSGPDNMENPQIPYLPTTKSLLVGTLVGTHRQSTRPCSSADDSHGTLCVHCHSLTSLKCLAFQICTSNCVCVPNPSSCQDTFIQFSLMSCLNWFVFQSCRTWHILCRLTSQPLTFAGLSLLCPGLSGFVILLSPECYSYRDASHTKL